MTLDSSIDHRTTAASIDTATALSQHVQDLTGPTAARPEGSVTATRPEDATAPARPGSAAAAAGREPTHLDVLPLSIGGACKANDPCMKFHPDLKGHGNKVEDWKRAAHAQEKKEVVPDSNGKYTPQYGDTLEGIARRLVRQDKDHAPDAFKKKFHDLLEANGKDNPKLLCNPDYIPPGTKLNIPGHYTAETPPAAIPVAPEARPGNPEVPAAPATPAPAAPEARPAAPDVPAVPATLVPAVPETGKGAPEIPAIPAAPAPGAPEARPAAPEIPAIPATPVPGAPEARPAAPEVPAVPATPVPGAPEARPAAPEVPAVPATPIPGAPEARPGSPEAPAVRPGDAACKPGDPAALFHELGQNGKNLSTSELSQAMDIAKGLKEGNSDVIESVLKSLSSNPDSLNRITEALRQTLKPYGVDVWSAHARDLLSGNDMAWMDFYHHGHDTMMEVGPSGSAFSPVIEKNEKTYFSEIALLGPAVRNATVDDLKKALKKDCNTGTVTPGPASVPDTSKLMS